MVSLFCHRCDVVMRRACFYCFLFSTYDFAVFFNFYQNLIVQIFIILSIITFNFFLGSLKLSGFVCSFVCCLDTETHFARGRWASDFPDQSLIFWDWRLLAHWPVYILVQVLSVCHFLFYQSQSQYVIKNIIWFYKMLLGLLFLCFILLSNLSLMFSFHFTFVTGIWLICTLYFWSG